MKGKDSFGFAWIIVGVSFTILGLTTTALSSFSLFFVALLKEFGWSRSSTAGAYSVFWILYGLIGPFAGSMLDRFGPRRVFVLGAGILGAGFGLCSLIHSWWQFCIFYGVIVGIGAGATGWVPGATVIQNWFKEKRGLAMGILSAGVGTGMFVGVPLIQHLIERVGWRMTYRIMAVFVPFVVITAAILVLKMRPQATPFDATDLEAGESGAKRPMVVNQKWASRSWTLRQAMATKPFWILSVTFFFSSLTTQSTLAHQVAFFVDEGLDALFASYIAGLVGIVSIGGKIFWANLSDRIGREVTYTIVVACCVSGMVLLIAFTVFSSSFIPYLYAIIFGLGYSGMTALPPLITADFFEGRSYGSIFGTLFILNTIGVALGAWMGGFIHDQAGNYMPFFAGMILCALVACLNLWIAAPRKIRRVPGTGRR